MDGINNHKGKEQQIMKCVICKQEITADLYGWEGGCNAEPVKEGKCCYKCDQTIVLPARLAQRGYSLEGD